MSTEPKKEEKCCEKCIYVEDNSGDGIGGSTEYCDNADCSCHREEKKWYGKEIQKRAIEKYRKTSKGIKKLKEISKKHWQIIKNNPILHEKVKLRHRLNAAKRKSITSQE